MDATSIPIGQTSSIAMSPNDALLAAFIESAPKLEYDEKISIFVTLRTVLAGSKPIRLEELQAAVSDSSQSTEAARHLSASAERRWEEAHAIVERWQASKVRIVVARDHGVPAAMVQAARLAGGVLLFRGDAESLDGKTVALLNSRKPRRINPGEPWIRALRELTRREVERGTLVLSSTGTLAYDLGSWCVLRWDGRLGLVLESPQELTTTNSIGNAGGASGDESADPACSGSAAEGGEASELFIGRAQVAIAPAFTETRSARKIRGKQRRDALVAILAKRLLGIAVRRDGIMYRLASQHLNRGLPLEVLEPSVLKGAGLRSSNWAGNVKLIDAGAQRIPPSEIEPVVDGPGSQREPETNGERQAVQICQESLDQAKRSDALFHYTRGNPGAWPGQDLQDYLEDLVSESSGPGPRDALAAVERILRDGCIRASSHLIRGSEDVVCLSEKAPPELNNLVKWRPGLVRWNLESCGIALRREFAESRGARPVLYVSPEEYDDIPIEDRFLYQRHSPPFVDWSQEAEWRTHGDLGLGPAEQGDFWVFVPDDQSRERLINCLRSNPIEDFPWIADHVITVSELDH